jgi:hypothetical protein
MQPARDIDELAAQRFKQVQPPRQRLMKAVEPEPIAVRRIDDRDLQGSLVQVVSLV